MSNQIDPTRVGSDENRSIDIKRLKLLRIPLLIALLALWIDVASLPGDSDSPQYAEPQLATAQEISDVESVAMDPSQVKEDTEVDGQTVKPGGDQKTETTLIEATLVTDVADTGGTIGKTDSNADQPDNLDEPIDTDHEIDLGGVSSALDELRNSLLNNVSDVASSVRNDKDPFADVKMDQSPVETASNGQLPHDLSSTRATAEVREQVAAPPKGLTISNAKDNAGDIHFLVNGKVQSLPAGKSFRTDGKPNWKIKFHRGIGTDTAELTVGEGIYEFRVTPQGWDLMELTKPTATEPQGSSGEQRNPG